MATVTFWWAEPALWENGRVSTIKRWVEDDAIWWVKCQAERVETSKRQRLLHLVRLDRLLLRLDPRMATAQRYKVLADIVGMDGAREIRWALDEADEILRMMRN